MAEVICEARMKTIHKVPTAEIMIDIKKIIVEEAVQCAQQTVVQQVDKDTEVEVEATPETVFRPVLLRGCSVEQFKSFHMAWALYAEKYRSQYRDSNNGRWTI